MALQQDDNEKEEARLDVVQFSNEGGGTLVMGAVEKDHILSAFVSVPDPQGLIRWIDDIVKEKFRADAGH